MLLPLSTLSNWRRGFFALVLIACHVGSLQAETTIGCYVGELSASLAKSDLPKLNRDGVVVVSSIAGGPAFEKLLPGDVIHVVGGKKIASVDEFKDAVESVGAGKSIKIAYSRIVNNKWKSDTIGLKVTDTEGLMRAAIGVKANGGTTEYFYNSGGLQEFDRAHISLRFKEVSGKLQPVLTVLFKQYIILEKIQFESETGTVVITTSSEDVNREDRGENTQLGEYEITPEQIDELGKVLATPSVTTRLIGWDGKTERQLGLSEWVGIRTSIDFYRSKTPTKKD